ncbi:hypothetical protein MVEG_01997 [Podila verticillata NRRL 6337]|nr:hypothetical protein MVEG_01997 [Podila verticillata NRRL 6337]
MHSRTSSLTFRRTIRVLFVALCSHGSPDADHISALSAIELSESIPKRLPKIIDLFLFNGEFEYLDIRLHEIYRDIDFFAIAESNETFTGMPKPLYFKDNAHLFDKFMDKIHYIQVPPMPANNIRANEAVWVASTTRATRPSRWCSMTYMSRRGESWDLISFELRYYRYAYDVYLGTRFTPVAMRYQEHASHLERVALNGKESVLYRKNKELLTQIGENDWATAGQQIRNCGGAGGDAMKVDDAGWHCSWCFGNMSQFLAKIDTYGHREYDTPEHRRQDYIIDYILQGRDFSNRREDPVFLESPDDIPEYIRKNKERVVVAETNTPKDWACGSCLFLSAEEQQCLGFGIVPATPFKSYSRKNVGYLWAIKQGATTVFDIDDDNLPSSKGFVFDSPTESFVVFDSKDAACRSINFNAHFGAPDIWPRGYPLTESHQTTSAHYLHSYGSLPEPARSVAAPASIDSARSGDGAEEGLREDQLLPRVSHNPVVSLQLCGSWRGYWVQRLLWYIDDSLAFTATAVEQTRSPVHNFLEDFKHDRKINTNPVRLTKFLTKWTSTSRDLETRIVELMDAMSKRIHRKGGRGSHTEVDQGSEDFRIVFPKAATPFSSKAVARSLEAR